MAHVFIISPHVKDAHGAFGLIHVLLHDRIATDDAEITFIQPTDAERDSGFYSFSGECEKFRNDISGHMDARKITHCPIHVPEAADGAETCAAGILKVIRSHDDPVCVLLDLGTSCENGACTALYRLFRTEGLDKNCILFAPYPDSDACTEWKKRNDCADFIARREDVTRARAIYVPLAKRLHDALGLDPY